MQLAFKREFRTPRWAMDAVVCSSAAAVFYLYLIWLTRTFRIGPPNPRDLIVNFLIFVFGYSFSMLVGWIFLRERWPSFVWVSIVGSAIVGITRVVIALPGAIEHYNRFTPDASLASYLISNFVPIFLWTALILAVVAMLATLFVRVMRSLFGTWLGWT